MSPRNFYWGINWASVLTHVKYHPRLSWTSHPSSFSLWRVCLCLCICLCHFPVQISNWVQSNHLKIKVVACPDVFRLPIKTWKCFWQVQMSKRRRRYFSNVLYWAAHPKFVKLAPVFPQKTRCPPLTVVIFWKYEENIILPLILSSGYKIRYFLTLSILSKKRTIYIHTHYSVAVTIVSQCPTHLPPPHLSFPCYQDQPEAFNWLGARYNY